MDRHITYEYLDSLSAAEIYYLSKKEFNLFYKRKEKFKNYIFDVDEEDNGVIRIKIFSNAITGYDQKDNKKQIPIRFSYHRKIFHKSGRLLNYIGQPWVKERRKVYDNIRP